MKLRQGYWPEIIIITLGAFLRIWLIDIKPPHFDEGINGWFVDQMQQSGFYDYDPKNYHGPWYFYLLFLSLNFLGKDLIALRLPAILGSIFGIIALLGFRHVIGRKAAFIAAALLALSPAATFFGRYSIHESWFATFSILFLLGILGTWKLKTLPYLTCLFVGLTGMLLTKETVLIHFGCAILAFPTLWVYNKISPPESLKPSVNHIRRESIVLLCCLSCLTLLLFYSGFFLNPQGVLDFLLGKAAWVETGIENSGHSKPWYYWLDIMRRYEWPTLLGLILCIRYLFLSPILPRYLAIYGTGVLVAYSIVSYKTPWCILPIQWPFLLIVGTVITELANKRAWLYAIPILALLGNIPTVIRLNFFEFDNEKEPYVYVQTFRDINGIIKPITDRAKQDPTLYQMGGVIALDSYYPLPWMLGSFKNIAYDKDMLKKDGAVEIPANIDFIIIYDKETELYEAATNNQFYSVPFRLRSGQAPCRVLLRKSLGITLENIKE